jgi:hypothetical protein
MEFDMKSFSFHPEIEDVGKGVVHACVSVFGNVDASGDIVCTGAFKRSLEVAEASGKFPPGVFYHDWKQPVARTLKAWEALDGLHVLGQFNLETQRGRETFSDIKAGIITEYSFGFRVLAEEKSREGRLIKDLEWYEWSPVLMGANRMTYTAGVKGLKGDSFDAEWLRLRKDFLRHRVDVCLGL